ncbi:MAG: SEC-C domain-containing protein [Marinicellaceae bacterium]
MKLGRNEKCWCNSGKKYKHCHRNRFEENKPTTWETGKIQKQKFSRRICLAPNQLKNECSNKHIRAHTISKSSSLSAISTNGHVYSLDSDYTSFFANKGPKLKLQGIKKASTFFGFCSQHDKKIFSDIENKKFVGSRKQCFLWGYRSVCLELYKKIQAFAGPDLYDRIDAGRPLVEQLRIQSFIASLRRGQEAGLKNIEWHKSLYDQHLITSSFESVRAYIIKFEKVLPILCSSALFPIVDFEGTRLNDISNSTTRPDLLSYASFAEGENGYVVFTWLPESDRYVEKFIQSIEQVTDNDLFNALTRFFLASTENIHFAPAWWDELSSETQEAAIKRISNTFAASTTDELRSLLDDGIHYGDFEVSSYKKL